MPALKIKPSIPFRRDWTERTLHEAFMRLAAVEPGLQVLARVIERDRRARWFGVYRVHALRLSASVNDKLPDYCKGHAFDIVEDFLLKLLIGHRVQRTLPLPLPKSALDRAALTCRLPEPEVLPPYEHTVATLARGGTSMGGLSKNSILQSQ